MNFKPSQVERPVGYEFRFDRVQSGMYAVNNAYEGRYAVFNGRPVDTQQDVIRHLADSLLKSSAINGR